MTTSLWNYVRAESSQARSSLVPPSSPAGANERPSADELEVFEDQRRPKLPIVPVDGLADFIAAIRVDSAR